MRWLSRGQKSTSGVSVCVCIVCICVCVSKCGRCAHTHLPHASCKTCVQPGYNMSRCPVYTVYALYREDQLLKRKCLLQKPACLLYACNSLVLIIEYYLILPQNMHAHLHFMVAFQILLFFSCCLRVEYSTSLASCF